MHLSQSNAFLLSRGMPRQLVYPAPGRSEGCDWLERGTSPAGNGQGGRREQECIRFTLGRRLANSFQIARLPSREAAHGDARELFPLQMRQVFVVLVAD